MSSMFEVGKFKETKGKPITYYVVRDRTLIIQNPHNSYSERINNFDSIGELAVYIKGHNNQPIFLCDLLIERFPSVVGLEKPEIEQLKNYLGDISYKTLFSNE